MSYTMFGGLGLGSYYETNEISGFGHYGATGGLSGLMFEDGEAFWIVKDASETLSSIAVKVYGDVTAQKEIYNANPQGRWPTTPPACNDSQWHCWGWYRTGTKLVLPLIPGFPDPMDSAPKADLQKEAEGTTIVNNDGSVSTVGKGGVAKKTKESDGSPAKKSTPKPKTKTSASPLAAAGMSTNAKIGLAAAGALLLIGIVVVAKKKKPAGAVGAPPQHAALPAAPPHAA